MKKKIWLGIGALIVIAISIGLYTLSSPSTPATNPALDSALQFEVTREDLSKTIDIKGKSSYLSETIVYAPYTAEITKWHIQDGAQVNKGDILFALDRSKLTQQIKQLDAQIRKSDLESQLSALNSDANHAAASLSLTEEEAKKNFVERESTQIMNEIDQINTEMNETMLAELQQQLERSNFKAHVSGIFLFDDSSKMPKSVQENERLGKIVNLDELQLVAYVGEQDVFQIRPDMPVKVKISALKNVTLEGKVEHVSKFAKSGTDNNTAQASQFQVNVSLGKNEHLIAGLSLTGSIETTTKSNVLVIPSIAIQREKEQHYVMVKTANGIEKRLIKIGLETPDKTEIIEGLQEKDTVFIQ